MPHGSQYLFECFLQYTPTSLKASLHIFLHTQELLKLVTSKPTLRRSCLTAKMRFTCIQGRVAEVVAEGAVTEAVRVEREVKEAQEVRKAALLLAKAHRNHSRIHDIQVHSRSQKRKEKVQRLRTQTAAGSLRCCRAGYSPDVYQEVEDEYVSLSYPLFVTSQLECVPQTSVYGSRTYGSGYPYGGYGYYVSNRPFPYVFIPVPIHRHYYGSDEVLFFFIVSLLHT